MLSGTQVSGSIDAVYQQALREAGSIGAEIASLTERYVKLREEEAAAYLALARLRLDDLGGESAIEDLTAAERQARRLLDRRSQALNAIDANIAELNAELARLTDERAGLAAAVEEHAEALEAAENAALGDLSETEAYKARLAVAEDAEKVAHHAERKAAFAEQDRIDKGKPYEDDPLFMYLWDRGFGTPNYRGGAIARHVDGWLARLIEFDKARANCAMLVEIPKRLKAHARRQRAHADAEAAKLDAMEQAALEAAEPAACRERHAAARTKVEAVEARMEALENDRAVVLDERAELNGGEDAATAEALDLIVAALKRDDLRQLRRRAERTPLPQDDTVVDRIEDIETDIEAIEAAVAALKAQQAEHRKRMTELERVRREHRKQDQESEGWDFRDVGMLSMMLTQVLGGALSGDGLRDQMNRRRVPRSGGGFGAGGPRMPRFPGGFGGGGRRTRIPRRGSGGGGFRTGGGF